MSIDRTTLLRGPGVITYDSASIHSTDDILVTLVEEYSDKITSGFARTGRALKNRYLEVKATPAMWTDLAKIFPYASAQIGDTVYGATDKPLVITPRNGAQLTLTNAAITALPSLKLASGQPTFKGAITWTCLVANATSASVMDNFYVLGAAASNVLLTGFTAANVKASRYTGTRNSVTLRSDQGFDIDFSLSLEWDQPDGEPYTQARISALNVSAKCRPVGLTEAAYAALLPTTTGIGDEPTGYDLTIAGAATGAPSVVVKNTIIDAGAGYTYGGAARLGELTFDGIRTITTNALVAAWTIGSVA